MRHYHPPFPKSNKTQVTNLGAKTPLTSCNRKQIREAGALCLLICVVFLSVSQYITMKTLLRISKAFDVPLIQLVRGLDR